MALHNKDSIREQMDDEIFASADLAVSVPKYKFPSHERNPRHAYSVVHDELMLDGNARQNLATFCQTWEEPEVRRLMSLCIDKNIEDKDEYPQTAEIEARCVHMLADLWNSPEGANTAGCSTIGSSEAAMLGGMAMKRRWEAKRKAKGKPIDKPNLIRGPVQICWHKFTRYWDVEHREIPMDPGRLQACSEAHPGRCDLQNSDKNQDCHPGPDPRRLPAIKTLFFTFHKAKSTLILKKVGGTPSHPGPVVRRREKANPHPLLT